MMDGRVKPGHDGSSCRYQRTEGRPCAFLWALHDQRGGHSCGQRACCLRRCWWCAWALAPTHGGAITASTAARARAIPAARRSTSGVRGSSRDRTASNRATRTAARRKATIAGKPALERAQETAGKAAGEIGTAGRIAAITARATAEITARATIAAARAASRSGGAPASARM